MLYSIGYQKMKDPAELIERLKARDVAVLLDVRSKPCSRKKGFHKTTLCAAVTDASMHYKWVGDTLGGFSQIQERTIRQLASWQNKHTACLMCMESDAKTCHRDYEIARRLKAYGVSVEHL